MSPDIAWLLVYSFGYIKNTTFTLNRRTKSPHASMHDHHLLFKSRTQKCDIKLLKMARLKGPLNLVQEFWFKPCVLDYRWKFYEQLSSLQIFQCTSNNLNRPCLSGFLGICGVLTFLLQEQCHFTYLPMLCWCKHLILQMNCHTPHLP